MSDPTRDRFAVFCLENGQRTFVKAFHDMASAEKCLESQARFGQAGLEIERQRFANGQWDCVPGGSETVGCGDCIHWHKSAPNPQALGEKMGQCRRMPPQVAAVAIQMGNQVNVQIVTSYPQCKPENPICSLFESAGYMSESKQEARAQLQEV